MTTKYILALDQGSSSSRVLLFNEQGEITARAARAVGTLRPAEGLAAFDAAALWQGQREALSAVLAQLPQQAQIAALCVASQRSTVVFWDSRTGQPLAQALSWQDGRAQAEADSAFVEQSDVHTRTGLYKTPFYSAAKISWTLKHVPAVAQAGKENRLCIGPVASYIIWQLTAGKVFACDATLAQRTLLFNITSLDWDDTLLAAFGVQRNWLPEIKQTADDYGTCICQGKQVPIRVCVGDQQAALYALKVTDGGACINYGTGAFFMRHTGIKKPNLPGMLTSVAATAQGQIEYMLEGPVHACGHLFVWLQSLGFTFDISDLDTCWQASQMPVAVLPALGGLGAPYWDFKARPVLAGLCAKTQTADVVRGALEALSLLLADIVFYTEKNKFPTREIKVTGGLSQSKALLQEQADVLQMPLQPYAESESTAVGTALLAAEFAGINTGGWQSAQPLPAVLPRLDPCLAQAKYDRWHAFLEWCRRQPY